MAEQSNPRTKFGHTTRPSAFIEADHATTPIARMTSPTTGAAVAGVKRTRGDR